MLGLGGKAFDELQRALGEPLVAEADRRQFRANPGAWLRIKLSWVPHVGRHADRNTIR
jgi:hypothetical protein